MAASRSQVCPSSSSAVGRTTGSSTESTPRSRGCVDEPLREPVPLLAAVVATPDQQELDRVDAGAHRRQRRTVEIGLLDRSAGLLLQRVDGQDEPAAARQHAIGEDAETAELVVDEEGGAERAQTGGDVTLEPDQHVVVRASSTGEIEHVAQALALIHRDHGEAARRPCDRLECRHRPPPGDNVPTSIVTSASPTFGQRASLVRSEPPAYARFAGVTSLPQRRETMLSQGDSYVAQDRAERRTVMTAPAQRTEPAPAGGPTKIRQKKYNRREALAGLAFISPWLFGFLIFTLGAMIYSLVISFTYYSLATNTARQQGSPTTRLLFQDPKVLMSLGTRSTTRSGGAAGADLGARPRAAAQRRASRGRLLPHALLSARR